MSIFKMTISLIREAESLVLGRKFNPRWRWARVIIDDVLHVPWFMFAGMHVMLSAIRRALVLIPIWWCVLYLSALMSGGDAATLHSGISWLVAALLALGSMLFSLPSSTTARGVQDHHISELTRYLESVAPDEHTSILLQACMEKIETAGTYRLSIFGWALGLYWAALLWLLSNWVVAQDASSSLREGAISYGFVALLVFLFFAVGYASYREASRMVSQTIAFAFLELQSNRRAET
jgi:hypothetical protein